MNTLYIGPLNTGSTCGMRANALESILSPGVFHRVDTDIPFRLTPALFRSVGFRYKIGPLIGKVNAFVADHILLDYYDLIWVDKAVYLTQETTSLLRGKAGTMLHFTPDPAFTFHRSSHFFRSVPYYDFLVTTKSFEMDQYESVAGKEKVILVSQGFDPGLHRPVHTFEEKKAGMVFIGHYEKDRAEVLSSCLDAGIPVLVAGQRWKKWAKKYKGNALLEYAGEGIYGEEYVKAISSRMFSPGFLSQWIKEYHTTRTFEIPACGTVLITPSNKETKAFFSNDEVVFIDHPSEIPLKIKHFLENPAKLKVLAGKGFERVHQGGFSYESIMRKILSKVFPDPK